MLLKNPGMWLLFAVLVLAVSGCKQPEQQVEDTSKKQESTEATVDADGTPAEQPPGDEDSSEGPTDPAATENSERPTHSNDPPTMEIPAWNKAGVGQEIGFGLEFVDAEMDEFTVELVKKPASATYDPYTLTVVFTPTEADMPQAEFGVKVTETIRDTGEKRVSMHGFSIDIYPEAQPEPSAQSLTPAVELLITIHDKERLAKVNETWPLDKMLLHGANQVLAAMPEAERAKVTAPTAEDMYKTLLKAHAKGHDNPTLDPDSPDFDAKGFGDPKSWKIIAVRPRLDKKWHEVRIVYRAKSSHSAAYVMFKWRPVAADATTEEQRLFNNKTFGQLTLDAFFTDAGDLDMNLFTDRSAHAERVDGFVNSILNYENADVEWANGTFLGLPSEARLGGGSKRGADGGYASGDGWGWHVMKAKVHDGKIGYENVVIKGFTTGVKDKDGKWAMACAPTFDPEDDAHDPRYAGLCRPSGHVDMPSTGDGYTDAEVESGDVVGSKVDAANMFVKYKKEQMVASLDLRDPRRDLFEEKGMTCHQCHVRKFGVRDMYDPAAYDASVGSPKRLNKAQDTLYFVITPTDRWRPYALDFQHKQECKFGANIEKYVGKKTSLTCPLKAE